MLAIIPARGGSKELPRKNIRLLNSKPLIAYTIEAAINSEFVSRVLVNTDDEEIAAISRQFGADCPFLRSKELATDSAKTIDVILDTLAKLELIEGNTIEDVIVLQPTSPLRSSQDIDQAILLFKQNHCDSVVSFCKENHPIAWHKHIDEDGKIHSILPVSSTNRQENEPTYYPNGAIYIFKHSILKKGHYYTENSYAYVMSANDSIDIDTEDDLKYAEFLLQQRNISC